METIRISARAARVIEGMTPIPHPRSEAEYQAMLRRSRGKRGRTITPPKTDAEFDDLLQYTRAPSKRVKCAELDLHLVGVLAGRVKREAARKRVSPRACARQLIRIGLQHSA